MKLKSFLFVASIIAFAGCTVDNDKATDKLQLQLDSTISSHLLIVDSLNIVIVDFEEQILSLKAQNNALLDSIGEFSSKAVKKGPKTILYPEPSGVPTEVPLKK
jgi:hypothetical protein